MQRNSSAYESTDGRRWESFSGKDVYTSIRRIMKLLLGLDLGKEGNVPEPVHDSMWKQIGLNREGLD